MIKSMTAYGRGEVETPSQKWVVELKSVNHRFLELSLNLPRRLWALEDRFRKLVKSRVARGRVDMQLSWESLEEKALTLRLDKALVAGVREVLEELRRAGNTPEPVCLEHFLHFSDLIVAKEQADIIFTQWPIDNHPDHRALFTLVYNAWRRLKESKVHGHPALYFYEVSNGEDTLMFAPTFYVDISSQELRKQKACFAHLSQSPEKFYSLQEQVSRFRGLESGCKIAEGFIPLVQSWPDLFPTSH